MKTRALLPLLLVFVLSCTFRAAKDEDVEVPFPPERGSAQAVPGYEVVRTAIIAPSCIGCHAQRVPSLGSYAEVVAQLPALRRRVVEEGSMPPGAPLPARTRALLKRWIDAGAPESAPVPPPPPPDRETLERPVRFATLRERVLETSCLSCHHAGNAEGLTDYSTPAAVRDSIGTLYYITAVKPAMPPAPAQVSREQKDILSAWIVDGMND